MSALPYLPPPPSGAVVPGVIRRNNAALLSICGKLRSLFDSSSLDGFVRTISELHTQIKTNAFLYATPSTVSRTGALNFLDQVFKTLIEKYKAGSYSGVYDAALIYCDALKTYHATLFPNVGTAADLYYIMILQKILEGKGAPLGARGASLLFKSRKARRRAQRKTRRRAKHSTV
jgi:hypothetical protein